MFISPKQAGQIAGTLGVVILAGGLTKILTSKIYHIYYQWQYQPQENIKTDKQAFEAAKQTANKVLSFGSAIVGLAAGVYFANYMGWITFPSLASRSSSLDDLPSTSPTQEMTEKVDQAVQQPFGREEAIPTSALTEESIKTVKDSVENLTVVKKVEIPDSNSYDPYGLNDSDE